MKVVTAWTTLWKSSWHPGHDSTDTGGWRQYVQSCLKEKKKKTFWSSERMINTFTESWLLDTWEPLCQVILPRKGGYTVCTIMCEVWFGYTRGRVALEASFYADPPQKRITGFAALSSHPDGIQGSSDSPEQALQSLCQPQISLT